MQAQDQLLEVNFTCNCRQNNNQYTNRTLTENRYSVSLSSSKKDTDDTLAVIKEILLSAYRAKTTTA